MVENGLQMVPIDSKIKEHLPLIIQRIRTFESLLKVSALNIDSWFWSNRTQISKLCIRFWLGKPQFVCTLGRSGFCGLWLQNWGTPLVFFTPSLTSNRVAMSPIKLIEFRRVRVGAFSWPPPSNTWTLPSNLSLYRLISGFCKEYWPTLCPGFLLPKLWNISANFLPLNKIQHSSSSIGL